MQYFEKLELNPHSEIFFKKFFHNKVMIKVPEFRVMIQQKVRKKKKPVLMLIFSTVSQKSWIIG